MNGKRTVPPIYSAPTWPPPGWTGWPPKKATGAPELFSEPDNSSPWVKNGRAPFF